MAFHLFSATLYMRDNSCLKQENHRIKIIALFRLFHETWNLALEWLFVNIFEAEWSLYCSVWSHTFVLHLMHYIAHFPYFIKWNASNYDHFNPIEMGRIIIQTHMVTLLSMALVFFSFICLILVIKCVQETSEVYLGKYDWYVCNQEHFPL